MRSHHCAKLNKEIIGETITICGWVNTNRDHGGVIFIDLRDRSGVAQIVIDPDTPEAFKNAESARNEFVLKATGIVRARPEGTVNAELASGEIEVLVKELEILNVSEPIPFQLDDDVSESVRLQHRYLDLRTPKMQKNMMTRHNLIQAFRNHLNDEAFIDIETPILTRSTPEGARDYLVPSRTHPGEFFALPQSPQLFKQILMVSGYERYYQVARCFRDEDLRADRQPEFTQLDIEMSFIDEEDIIGFMENMVSKVLSDVADIDLPTQLPRMTYAEAMSRYGSDRPDLRIPLELVDIKDLMKDVEFKVFSGPANDENGRVAAMKVEAGGQKLSRLQIDKYTEYVKQFGAKGLAYIKVNELAKGIEGLQSPIIKFMPEDVVLSVMQRLEAKDGDIVFFGADKTKIVNDALGNLRIKVGKDLDMLQGKWEALWVVDFPLLEYDETSKRHVALHHPFTSPKDEDVDKLTTAPTEVISRAYDLVLNGTELGGGSIRIHNQNVQKQVFAALGIDEAEANEKFGFLLRALQLGAPPHGGIAFGLDRISAMICGMESIRDVIAFPKTQKAACSMTQAPSDVADTQLKELGLRLRKANVATS